MKPAPDQPRGAILWRIVHLYAAGTWGLLLAMVMFDIATHGDLPRTANTAGHYQTSFVLWLLSLLAATVASSIRALWLESRE